MGCHVDFNLTEADLETLFEIAEELTVFHEVFDVDHDPHQIVRTDLFLVPPTPSNDLGFPRDCDHAGRIIAFANSSKPGFCAEWMKNRIALAPAFPGHPPMLARVLSAALSRHSLPWETTAEVNGIEAFPVEVEVHCGWGDTLIVMILLISPFAELRFLLPKDASASTSVKSED